MPLARSLAALALLAGTSTAIAAPVFRVEAGYTQFQLEHQIDKNQNLGGLVVDHHKDAFDSGNAFRLAAEAGWGAGENLEWIAGLAAIYSSDAEKDMDANAFIPGLLTLNLVNNPQPLEEMYTFKLYGGLRWQQNLTQKLRFHADAAVSLNQWRYSYNDEYIDLIIDPNSSQNTQFVQATRTITDDDRYLALDAVLGLYYAFTPDLDAVLDASAYLAEDYRNLQYNAGLRYKIF